AKFRGDYPSFLLIFASNRNVWSVTLLFLLRSRFAIFCAGRQLSLLLYGAALFIPKKGRRSALGVWFAIRENNHKPIKSNGYVVFATIESFSLPTENRNRY
ncbi:hypothetical protein, partial [Alcanivorax sp. UBA3183]